MAAASSSKEKREQNKRDREQRERDAVVRSRSTRIFTTDDRESRDILTVSFKKQGGGGRSWTCNLRLAVPLIPEAGSERCLVILIPRISLG